MSAKNIRAAIERFLVSDTPQVLCIRGAWGTGKTFNWKTISRELRDKPAAIALNEYSYVSLFGLNSLNEVKTQILQSMVVRAQIGNPPDLTSFGNAISTVESGLKKGVIKTVTSVLGSRGDALVSAMGFFTNRVIVCLDDFERKGAKLSNTDVLGLVTYLKEERDCKVVLLLNDMKLDDRKTFDNYLEKVVDLDLRFEPTPEEIANIAIPEDGRDNIGEMVRANAITLGINNVRVIRKIIGLVRDVAPMLTEYSFRVTMNATSTITLLGWSYFQPELAPPLDYLKRVNTFAPHKDENELDLKWRDLLLKYRYHSSSPFDLTLLKGIENGYFEEAEIDKHAVELHNADVKDKSDNEMKEIWDELYYTFIKPQKSTFDRFYEAYTRNIELMSLGTMGHIEKLFRELNDNRAGEVVDLYIDANKNTAGAFDVSQLYDRGNELPKALRDRLEAAARNQKPVLSADELLLALEVRGSEMWITVPCASIPVTEYKRILTTYEGPQLASILAGIRQYLNWADPTPEQKEIIKRAATALRQIASESPINALRVRRLGIIQWLERHEATEKGFVGMKPDADAAAAN